MDNIGDILNRMAKGENLDSILNEDAALQKKMAKYKFIIGLASNIYVHNEHTPTTCFAQAQDFYDYMVQWTTEQEKESAPA